MKNWKTTLLGILTILATLSAAGINYLKTGQLPDVTALLTGLGAGWALVWAKDPAAPVSTTAASTTSKILPLLLVVSMFSGCAWYQTHKTQLVAVGEVALKHIAADVVKVAASALVNEAQTGFNGDWASSLTQGAYALTPDVLSSGNLQDYLDAWNPAAPSVNAAIAKTVSATLPGDKVEAALKDPTQAKALASQVGVTIGNAVLAATNGTTVAQ